ncbi:MAG: hypothetical protein QOJ10_100 [Chloroflexota bacterium]|nr:hypothetical protein [Chloroflexota bacterium]
MQGERAPRRVGSMTAGAEERRGRKSLVFGRLGRSAKQRMARGAGDRRGKAPPEQLGPDLVEHLPVAKILALPGVEAKGKEGGGLKLLCRAKFRQGSFGRSPIDAARGELPGDGNWTLCGRAPAHIRTSKRLVVQGVRLMYALNRLVDRLLLVTALTQLPAKLFPGVVSPAQKPEPGLNRVSRGRLGVGAFAALAASRAPLLHP